MKMLRRVIIRTTLPLSPDCSLAVSPSVCAVSPCSNPFTAGALPQDISAAATDQQIQQQPACRSGPVEKGITMKKTLLLHFQGLLPALLACLLGLTLILQAGTGHAEVFYGIDGNSIYSVDTNSGGPQTTLVTFATPIYGATLATRPSDGMLFYLDSAGLNPNLWRWNPATPTVMPVLIGTPGATTTGVIRLGFDANDVLYAMNPGPATIWTLNPNSGAILTATNASGAAVPAGGDICLQPGTGTLYTVAAQQLFTVTSAGVVTLLGNITGLPANAPGCAFDSGGRLVVAAGAQLYQVTIGTRAAVALPAATTSSFGDLSSSLGRSADIRLSQTASNLTPGNTVSFTITVVNDGPDRATDVRVLTTLPALSPGLTFLSANSSQGSYTSATGIWSLGAVNSGGSATLMINLSVTTAGAKTNTAQVSYSDIYDPDSVPNNSNAAEDDQASVTITPSPDLQVVKAATSSFAVGAPATYTLTVNNLLGSLTTGANTYTVTDIMPIGLTISVLPPTGTGWNCAASTATQLNCSSSTPIIAGGTGNPITLTVLPAAAATPSVANTATVSGGGEPPSNNGNNGNTIVTPVCIAGGCPDLIVNKSVAPDPMTVGTAATYTLSVTNQGGLTTGATSYTLDDTLPTGLTLNAAPTAGAGWTCTPGNPVPLANSAGGTRVYCTRATAIAPAGTSTTVTFPVTVAAAAAPSVTNSATISGGGEPPASTGNNTTSRLTTVRDFDLSITKTKTVAGNFVMGTNAAYTITVSNSGAIATPATTYTVTDTLPAGLTYVSGVGTNWTCGAAGQVVTCTRAIAIAAGTAAPAITLTVTPTGPSAPSVTNRASVSHPSESPNLLANNTSADVTTPVDAPDLTVTKTHNGNMIVGSNGIYTITVHNIGFQNSDVGASDTITVTDTLPTGLTFVSAAGTDWTCGAAGQVVTCTRTVSINANTSGTPISLTVAVAAAAAAASPVTNPVSVAGGNEPTGNSGNNTDADVTNVYITPTITKAFTTSPVVSGSPSKLTLTITNPVANTVNLADLAVIDNFPAGMSVAVVPNFSNSCGGAVSPGQNQGDTMISLSGGSLLINTSCTIQVDVVSTTIGANVNTTQPVTTSNSGTGLTATATLNVTVPPNPTLIMTSSPDPVGVNMPVTLTYTLNNNNLNRNTAARSLGFTHNFPVISGAQMVWLSTVSNTCTAAGIAGTVTALAANAGIQVANFRPTANATCTIVITAAVNATGTVTTANGNPGINSLLPAATLVSNVNDTFNIRGMTLTKAFSPTTIPRNGTSTLTFTITNDTGYPAQNGLSFTETLPANLTVTTTGSSTQCNGTVTTNIAARTITLAGGNMSLGQATCTIDVDVTSATDGTYVNDSTKITTGPSTGMTNSVNATLIVAAPPTLTKSFLPIEVGAGQTSLLTLTINNIAGNPAQASLGFTDTLPANLVLADGITSNTCNGTLSDSSNNPLAANATSIKLADGSIASGTANCSITVNVKSVVPATYTNSTANGNITGATGGLSLTGASSALTVSGTTLTKAFSPSTTALNDPVTLTFSIANNSLTYPAQSGLSFTDTLGGMTLSAVPASPQCGGTVTGSIGGNVAGFSGGSLGTGVPNCTVVFSGVASAVGSYVNNAANMSNISPGMTNSVNATLTVNNLPSVAKQFLTSPAAIGQPVTLQFTITNPVGAPARTLLSFTDTLRAGLSIVNPPAPASNCNTPGTLTALNGTQTFTASNFGVSAGAGGSCTITVSVAGSSLGAKINGTADISVTNINNDVTDQTLQIVNDATLTVLKTATLDSGTSKPGDIITYTLLFTNTGDVAASNISVSDVLSPYIALGTNSYPAAPAPLGPVFEFFGSGTYPTPDTPQYFNSSNGAVSPLLGAYDGRVAKWTIPFTGTLGGGNSFTLRYKTQIR